ncbi:SEN34 subunit of tRNA-splicing endonuclease [Saccharata proteae CBS 121410]|uniref:tRNA-splicing endonuclease subunit Sen34 n=1 Tax=Saccharata proteae CBS 121410 TaxID=1314787 RepID=A0A9P4LVY9_9PEZI|nr:SEN34 subunit of tRNA-splicing endonuclease [Saccharata proteae CBS 121410]
MGDDTTRAHAAVPISHAGSRYLLYDTNDISYLRRNHNICGVLIGTLPGHPQQNVFLGTPLELMPEEARLLVEEGVAYIVDDVEAHKAGIMGLKEAERKAFLRALEKQGLDAMKASQKKATDLKEIAMKKNADKIAAKRKERSEADTARADPANIDESSSLFAPSSPRPTSPSPSTMSKAEERFYITPSTSHPPLPSPPITPPPSAKLPEVPRSYPLFAYLHSKGYFMSPGLRFGCQYCVYPGDPLRFHSHFLAVGMGWDDEFDLMQVVGGGRLGTGVKKGFLIGGKDDNVSEVDNDGDDVRAFCIEWSGM